MSKPVAELTDAERWAEILDAVRSMPMKYSARQPKKPPELKTEKTYEWFVNEFLPVQPDFPQLARLLFLYGFRVELLIAGMISEAKFIEVVEALLTREGVGKP